MKDSSVLDNFVTAVEQQDTHKRLKAAEEIITYVNEPDNSFDFPGVERFIDGLLGWAGSSNFKVSQYGLEILAALAERLGGSFRPFLNQVIPVIVDRLGDSKSQVREQAHNVLMKLMDPVSNPQAIFELLNPKFSHKNWRVREELMICMVKVIETFGASSLTISKQMPAICKLLSDPTSKVRDAAVYTIVEVYRHVGEKVRSDLSRRGIPAARLAAIFAKFDECLHSGNMVVENNDHGPGYFVDPLTSPCLPCSKPELAQRCAFQQCSCCLEEIKELQELGRASRSRLPACRPDELNYSASCGNKAAWEFWTNVQSSVKDRYVQAILFRDLLHECDNKLIVDFKGGCLVFEGSL